MNPRFGITMPSPMSHRHYFAVIASVGAIALVAVLAAEVVFSRLISAELGLDYLAFSRISSLSGAIAKLLEFHEIWYRPLTLYVTNYLVFRVIDTHDIVTLKALGFCIIALNALVATWLARRVLSSGFVECVLIFSLIVSHPLYFRIAYDGSGIGDPVFTIFLNLFLICYLTLLEASNPRLGHTIRLARGRSLLLCVLCGVFVIGTVIAHERGLAIFMMAGALFAFYHLPQRSRRAVRWSPAEIGTMLWCAVVFLAYLAFVYANKKPWAGAHYRTGLDVDYILPNLLKAIELPLRLLIARTNSAYDVHLTIGFNLVALPLIACLVTYVWHVYRSGDCYERQRVLVVATFFFCALPIPVLFGSAWWHFYTAATYLSIVMGRAVWFCLQRMNWQLRAASMIGFFALLSVSTVRGIAEELQPGGVTLAYMSVVPRALQDKVLNDIQDIPEVIYYDTGSYGDDTSPFGQGNLFKLLYKNPRIVEIGVSNDKVLTSDQHLCATAAGKRALSFKFDAEKLAWSVGSSKPCLP